MRKSILFIVNPISGGKEKKDFPAMLSAGLDASRFTAAHVFTEGRGHATELSRKGIYEGYDAIISVGGDGTINEIASVLAGTGTAMGIIPCGSGNGLARALGIPLSPARAVSRLNLMNESFIDSARLNTRSFFNMAGMGFDAHISAKFARDGTRGLKGYIRSTVTEIATYRPQQYEITVDGETYNREAFMLSIANSSQFGNNAHVSPKASVKDGLLDVCIIKPFPLYHFPVMGYHMFSKTADRSRYVEIVQGREILIRRENPGPVHLDGEPFEMEREIAISIRPLSLKILI